MTAIDQRLWRVATAIHGRLAASRCGRRLIELPVESWQRCDQLVRQIRRVELRGWHLAAQELRRDLGYTVPSLQHELSAITADLTDGLPPETATVGDIYRDLVALREEFGGLDFEPQARWLSVTTEPIELERICLGPFEIRFELDRPSAADEAVYRVIATDPHPAESRDSVTHPHVTNESLCEGEGRHAIRRALSEGRLLDFFTLVAGILRTYSAESPFVSLAEWYGQSCSDCGGTIASDEAYVCQRCDEVVCAECEILCRGCESSYCASCITFCAACEDNYCRGCLQPCSQCQASVCGGCLAEDERCQVCHENEAEVRNGGGGPAVVGAAVQPHGLGQAPVPA